MPTLLRRISKHVEDPGISRGCSPKIGREPCRRRTDGQGASCSGVRTQDFPISATPRPERPERIKGRRLFRLEIAEIAYLAAINAAGNRLATLLALPPDPLEEIDANWFERLKRPFTRNEFRAAHFLTLSTCLILGSLSVLVRGLCGLWKARRQAPRWGRFSTARGIPP